MIIQPFVFNWNGKHKNVKRILRQLNKTFNKVTVINSDDNYRPKNWINIGDKFYFSGQFNTALKNFSGDVLFHIQGDVSYNRWEKLVDDAIRYMNYYSCGIYSPNIHHTFWPTKIGLIEDEQNILDHKNLDLVSCTDETVWFIHKDIIDKLKEYDIKFCDSDFGWGIDLVLAAISFLDQKLVLRDSNHKVSHPKGTGYNKDEAQKQLEKFYKTLPDNINQCISLIINKKKQDLYKHLL